MKLQRVATAVKNFIANEDGPTAVEYAIMLALIVAVCITAIGNVGVQASAMMENNAEQMDAFMNN
jgi:pilus assembly protein Flp/PilA